MTSNITKTALSQGEAQRAPQLFDDWFDPIETAVRDRAREFIEELIRSELDVALARPRYERSKKVGREGTPGITGHRHGSRPRLLTGSFGPIAIAVPRARLNTADGKTTEWKSQSLRAYQRRTLVADALIAGLGYLAGTNTRRVRRALSALFAGAVGKDTVSRVWRKVRSDWDAWNARPLAEEPIVRLILDGTVVRVRLDARRPRYRCWSSSACVRTVRKCCSRSRAWVARAPKPGVPCSAISSGVACGAPSSSSSMARPVLRLRSPRCGTGCQYSAVPSTSIGICWRMHPSACMTR
jgi:hypothetical protein